MSWKKTNALALASMLLSLSGCFGTHSRLDVSSATRSDAGVDANRDSGIRDSGSQDAGIRDSASDAGALRCDEPQRTLTNCGGFCEVVPNYVWDGFICKEAARGCGQDGCIGPDCANIAYPTFATLEDCNAAYTHCDARLCAQTNGRWIPESCSTPQLLGHYICGEEPDCSLPTMVPAEGCDCGQGRNFVLGQGCVNDVSCPAPDPNIPTLAELCVASGGTPQRVCCARHECGIEPRFECACEPPGEGPNACQCPLGETYQPGRGCMYDPKCIRGPQRSSCEGSEVRCAVGLRCYADNDSELAWCHAPCDDPTAPDAL